MSKKKPVVKVTTEPVSYTVVWVDLSGITHTFTFTDKAEAEAKYDELYQKYIYSDIRDLQLRVDL